MVSAIFWLENIFFSFQKYYIDKIRAAKSQTVRGVSLSNGLTSFWLKFAQWRSRFLGPSLTFLLDRNQHFHFVCYLTDTLAVSSSDPEIIKRLFIQIMQINASWHSLSHSLSRWIWAFKLLICVQFGSKEISVLFTLFYQQQEIVVALGCLWSVFMPTNSAKLVCIWSRIIIAIVQPLHWNAFQFRSVKHGFMPKSFSFIHGDCWVSETQW